MSSRRQLKDWSPIITETLRELSPFTNEDKTKVTHPYLSKIHNQGENKISLEDWKKRMVFEAKLCSSSPVAARCVDGNLVFWCFWNKWICRLTILQSKRLRIFSAIFVPLVMHNCTNLAITNTAMDKFDALKHQRTFTRHRWPSTLTSKKAMFKICSVSHLSTTGHNCDDPSFHRMISIFFRSLQNSLKHKEHQVKTFKGYFFSLNLGELFLKGIN